MRLRGKESKPSNLRVLLLVALLCSSLLSGCLLAVTSIVAPDSASTGEVIIFSVNGTATSNGQSTRGGIILQIPSATKVLRAHCGGDFFKEDQAITSGYTSEAGYYLYGASTTESGNDGNTTEQCTVWLAVPEGVTPGTYTIKAAVGGYDPANIWIPQSPQHNGVPIKDFSQIGGNYVSNNITISAGSPDTIPPADVYPSVGYNQYSPPEFQIFISGYDEAAQGGVAKYRIYVSKSSFTNTIGSQLDGTTTPSVTGNNNNSVTFSSDIGAGLFYFEIPPGAAYTISIYGFPLNTQYYFAVTAVDLSGNESNPVVIPGEIIGGSISGRVTDGSVGIGNVSVRVYDTNFNPISSALTDANGNYLVDILSGTYKVQFKACSSGYQSEWYYDQSTFNYADQISVTVPDETTGVDAVLATFSVLFDDIPSGFWAEDYVKALYCEGVTTGCTQTPLNYCPSNNVTRQAMAAFIIRALYGEDFTYPGTPYFTDVPDTHQFFKYIQKMRELNITTGCTATEYCPGNNVTRQAMAAFLIRAKLGETFTYSTTPYFTDVPATNQFFKYVQKMKDESITTGCTATQYCAGNNVTRASMGAFLARAFLGMP